MRQVEIEAPRGAVHKPCAHNPQGAHKEMCEHLSGVPAHAQKCVGCHSRWRKKNVPPTDPDGGVILTSRRIEEIRKPTQDRTEDILAIVRSGSSKKADQEPEEADTGEWRDVLTRVKAAMANSKLVVVDPKTVRPMPGQPREFFSETSLTNLRESIRTVGQIQAGIIREVYDGEGDIVYELLDGERRWRCVVAEEISFYRAQLVEVDDEAAPYMVAAIANFNREGHTPLEVSDAIHKLRSGPIKVPMKEIAKLFGVSEMWTYQMAGLKKLHPSVREMLSPDRSKDDLLPLTAAIQISKLDSELQVGIAERVLRKEVSLARLRQTVIETGERAGAPVRTRQLEPRKLLASFGNRLAEMERHSSDLSAQYDEMAQRHLVPQRGTSRREEVFDQLGTIITRLTVLRDKLA